MKATGIIRRIDDLGRVVIPKEVRRTLHIQEGDPLELFTEGDVICFRKYSPNSEISRTVEVLAEQIAVPEVAESLDATDLSVIKALIAMLQKTLKS